MLPDRKTQAPRSRPPPPFKNHGNEVISVSALARYQQRQAEEGGAYILTETVGHAADRRGRPRRRRPLRRQGPRQGRRAAGQLRARHRHQGAGRRCSPRAAGATSPAPRSASSTSAEGREPQVWELGVKEVWKVAKPLDRVIHTIGPWPLKLSAKYGQIGGTWIYPMKDEKTGDDLVSIGFVVDLEYADATTSAHDLLQQFKLHPLVKEILEGGERVGLGRQGAARAAATGRCPSSRCRARCSSATPAGMVDTVGAQGRPPLHQVGHARRARRSTRSLKSGATAVEPTRTRSRSPRSARSSTRSATPASRSRRASSIGGPLVGPGDRDQGQGSRRAGWRGTATTPSRCSSATPRERYPKPDGKYTFDKLSSVYITGNATRDDAPNHIRVHKKVPAGDRRDVALDVPGRGVRDPRRRARVRARRRDRQLHQLRPVRRDHGQGRSPDAARGRRRAAVPDHLTASEDLVRKLPADASVQRVMKRFALPALLRSWPTGVGRGDRGQRRPAALARLHQADLRRPRSIRRRGRSSITAVMRPLTGTTKLQIEFQLYSAHLDQPPVHARARGRPGRWVSPSDPTLGERSADVWIVIKQVVDLSAPATYRFRVAFRWIGDHDGRAGHGGANAAPAATSPSCVRTSLVGDRRRGRGAGRGERRRRYARHDPQPRATPRRGRSRSSSRRRRRVGQVAPIDRPGGARDACTRALPRAACCDSPRRRTVTVDPSEQVDDVDATNNSAPRPARAPARSAAADPRR